MSARIAGVVLALRWSFTRGLLSNRMERVVTPILSKWSRVNNVIRDHIQVRVSDDVVAVLRLTASTLSGTRNPSRRFRMSTARQFLSIPRVMRTPAKLPGRRVHSRLCVIAVDRKGVADIATRRGETRGMITPLLKREGRIFSGRTEL